MIGFKWITAGAEKPETFSSSHEAPNWKFEHSKSLKNSEPNKSLSRTSSLTAQTSSNSLDVSRTHFNLFPKMKPWWTTMDLVIGCRVVHKFRSAFIVVLAFVAKLKWQNNLSSSHVCAFTRHLVESLSTKLMWNSPLLFISRISCFSQAFCSVSWVHHY